MLFATSALGMRVNAPHVEHIIHVTPPGNIESYVQETGRAGRTGIPSGAALYYNNSDIANNKTHVQESMRDYCRSHETCLRKLILEYLGFSIVTHERCCCVCDRTCNNAINNSPKKVTRKVRTLPTDNKTVLEELIFSELNEFQTPTNFTGATLFSFTCEKNLFQRSWKELNLLRKNQTSLTLTAYGMRPVPQRSFPL